MAAPPDHRDRALAPQAGRRRAVRRVVRRHQAPRAPGPRPGFRPGPAHPGRADQPPGYRLHRLAGGLPPAPERGPALRHPRPRLPAAAGHTHRGTGSLQADQLGVRLRHLSPAQGRRPVRRSQAKPQLRPQAGRGGDVDQAGHQGQAHPEHGPRPRPAQDARGAARPARAHRPGQDDHPGGRAHRQTGHRGQGPLLRLPGRQVDRRVFHHHHAR